MESESLSQLLQKLIKAVRRWADRLPHDRFGCRDARLTFDLEVAEERLNVLTTLGADRREYLAALIDAALNKIIEKGEDFVIACEGVSPPKGSYWEDVPVNKLPVGGDGYPFSFTEPGVELFEELYNCDNVLYAVDAAIRRVDSLGSDEVTAYKPQIEKVGYFPGELKDELSISDGSLNTYAKNAGVVTPGVGKGRVHRYSLADVAKICGYIREQVGIKQVVARAEELLLKIETKSKTES